MGVEDAFGQVNFSGISGSLLAISRVFHLTFIDVKEEDTEASAQYLRWIRLWSYGIQTQKNLNQNTRPCSS